MAVWETNIVRRQKTDELGKQRYGSAMHGNKSAMFIIVNQMIW